MVGICRPQMATTTRRAATAQRHKGHHQLTATRAVVSAAADSGRRSRAVNRNQETATGRWGPPVIRTPHPDQPTLVPSSRGGAAPQSAEGRAAEASNQPRMIAPGVEGARGIQCTYDVCCVKHGAPTSTVQ